SPKPPSPPPHLGLDTTENRTRDNWDQVFYTTMLTLPTNGLHHHPNVAIVENHRSPKPPLLPPFLDATTTENHGSPKQLRSTPYPKVTTVENHSSPKPPLLPPFPDTTTTENHSTLNHYYQHHNPTSPH
ncbi:Hypothetical predicted protein, partial [Olea europaea subsp. europaea]